jgi:hypothetical protein
MKFYVIKIRVYSKEESVTHQEIETRFSFNVKVNGYFFFVLQMYLDNDIAFVF